MSRSPNLAMPFIMPAQAQKHVTHNEAIEILDVLVQLRIAEINVTEPPLDPAEGLVVAVSAGSGAFAGQDGMLACYLGGGWVFVPLHDGFMAWIEAEQGVRVYKEGMWATVSGAGSAEAIDGIGVNATWDSVNRLSVASQATLLSHEGGDHRLTVNKAGKIDTASLLFADRFSARAEMGLVGTNDFSIKVSPDGASWTTALFVEATSGTTTLGSIEASEIRGEAVQVAPDDVTPGRLMRADWGYGPGNIIGSVSKIDGSISGAVIECGENGEGHYTRWADGTQTCWRLIEFDSSNNNAQEFSMPVAFLAGTTVASSLSLRASDISGNGWQGRVITQQNTCIAADANSWIARMPDTTNAGTVLMVAGAVGRWV